MPLEPYYSARQSQLHGMDTVTAAIAAQKTPLQGLSSIGSECLMIVRQPFLRVAATWRATP